MDLVLSGLVGLYSKFSKSFCKSLRGWLDGLKGFEFRLLVYGLETWKGNSKLSWMKSSDALSQRVCRSAQGESGNRRVRKLKMFICSSLRIKRITRDSLIDLNERSSSVNPCTHSQYQTTLLINPGPKF